METITFEAPLPAILVLEAEASIDFQAKMNQAVAQGYTLVTAYPVTWNNGSFNIAVMRLQEAAD